MNLSSNHTHTKKLFHTTVQYKICNKRKKCFKLKEIKANQSKTLLPKLVVTQCRTIKSGNKSLKNNHTRIWKDLCGAEFLFHLVSQRKDSAGKIMNQKVLYGTIIMISC